MKVIVAISEAYQDLQWSITIVIFDRDELEKEERAENAKKNTPSRDWMGQDIGEALQIIIHKLKVNKSIFSYPSV